MSSSPRKRRARHSERDDREYVEIPVPGTNRTTRILVKAANGQRLDDDENPLIHQARRLEEQADDRD